MQLTKEQLLCDLYVAFYDARKHKATKKYVIEFENNLHQNLIQLRDELYNKTYKHNSFVAFIANRPKPREIFAADFRDRIVHHLYYNYVHLLFENTFIYDCYSCIKHKGTDFGIQRLKHHISSVSNNYQNEAYFLKIDIKAYFININRIKLLNIVLGYLDKFEKNPENKQDFDFLRYLSNVIILLDPIKNVKQRNKSAWKTYKKSKSLFYAKINCGLPIGNLTSQLFSNIYLNVFDQYCKRVLKLKHYGRYVDDAYAVHNDNKYLRKCIPLMEKFLNETLGLNINKGKIYIKNIKYGCEFLGAYIKPFRTYISNQTLYRMRIGENIQTKQQLISSLNSRLGMLKKYKTYNIRKHMIGL